MPTQTEYDVLNDEQIAEALKSLPGWERDGVAIKKDFEFKSFLEAVAFFNRVAAIANEMDHHPDAYISYTDVTMRIWTHKKKAITKADVALAQKIQQLQ